MTAKPAKKKMAKPAVKGAAVKPAPLPKTKTSAMAPSKPAPKAEAPKPAPKIERPVKSAGKETVKPLPAAGKAVAKKVVTPEPQPVKGRAKAAKPKAGAAVTAGATRSAKIKPLKKAAEPKLPEPPPIPVKSSLTKKELEQFRRLLQNKHRDFTEAYRTSKGDSRTDLSNGTEDYIDYAVSSYSKEFLLSLTEMDRRQLQLVQEALRRIDHGEYGLCMQCGQEIPRKRLEVQPWARHCVRCQELEEQGLLRPTPYPGDGEGEFGEEPLELSDEEFGVARPARRVEVDEDEEEAEEEEEEEEAEEPAAVVEDPEPSKAEVEGEPIVLDEEDEGEEPDKDAEEEE